MRVYESDDSGRAYVGIGGTSLPLSLNQFVNNKTAGLDGVRAVQRLNNGNFLVCDMNNDRVLELDRDGDLVSGFIGVGELEGSSFRVIAASYNPTSTVLSLTFTQPIDIDLVTLSKILLADATTTVTLGGDTTAVFADKVLEIHLTTQHALDVSAMVEPIILTLGVSAVGSTSGVFAPANYNLPVYVADLYNVRLQSPLDAVRLTDGNTVIAHTLSEASVIEVDSEGNLLWSDSNATFEVDLLGSVQRVEDTGNTVIADSGNKRMIEVTEENDVIFEYAPQEGVTVSDAKLMADDTFAILENSETDDTASRFIIIDRNLNVLVEFGAGQLKNPSDVRVLENGNVLLST